MTNELNQIVVLDNISAQGNRRMWGNQRIHTKECLIKTSVFMIFINQDAVIPLNTASKQFRKIAMLDNRYSRNFSYKLTLYMARRY